MKPKVAVVGSVNVDLVTTADRLPRPGETLRGSTFSIALGGKGANQAVAAAKLGAETLLVAAVGDDPFGAFARQRLAEQSGLDLASTQTLTGITTGIAAISIDSVGQNCITIVGGANDHVTPARVTDLAETIACADILMLQGEIAPHASLAAARLMRERGKLVIFDPAPVPSGGFPAELLAMADFVTPNETEATALTGIAVTGRDSAIAAARALLAQGARHVVVKLGAAGAMAISHAEVIAVPAFPVTVVDTVAAGDSFNAGLAVALAQRIALADSLRFAAACGALATTRRGASEAAPQEEAVERLLGI